MSNRGPALIVSSARPAGLSLPRQDRRRRTLRRQHRAGPQIQAARRAPAHRTGPTCTPTLRYDTHYHPRRCQPPAAWRQGRARWVGNGAPLDRCSLGVTGRRLCAVFRVAGPGVRCGRKHDGFTLALTCGGRAGPAARVAGQHPITVDSLQHHAGNNGLAVIFKKKALASAKKRRQALARVTGSVSSTSQRTGGDDRGCSGPARYGPAEGASSWPPLTPPIRP